MKGIEREKKEYFDRVFVAYKCDMKKTRQVISETLHINKNKHEMPSLFTHEGRDLVGSTKIANAFNTYFANIGKNLSSQIDQNIDEADYKQYQTSYTAENLRFEGAPGASPGIRKRGGGAQNLKAFFFLLFNFLGGGAQLRK